MMWFLIAVAAALAVILFLALRQPDNFRITRTAVIDGPATFVFDFMNDLHKWQTWSPWARADADAKITYTGPETGVGSSFSWEGPKTGAGSMTNIESRTPELVRFRLVFEKPMKATNTAEFILTPQGQQTHVAWSMYGSNNLMGKCMSVFINCDKMVGKQFDEGLVYLNEAVQKASAN